MKSLLELYEGHDGKVSDKWLLYLSEYDRLFKPYRQLPISLLEIGVQNGGSLEIWSQYFSNGIKFVGCDINPDCQKLTYDDSRIAVIVGDATTSETQQKIHDQSATFDLIIEDGSHTSGDIIKAFARYFPLLKEGGLFVAEDLHCSYWQEFEGGIFHPYSSMNFFKHLADVINHEHWGVDRDRTQLLSGFKNQYQIDLDEDLLSQIHSIEFINSICIIRKSNVTESCLGGRFITGSTELVVGGHEQLHRSQSGAILQSSNEWSNLQRSPLESYSELTKKITAKQLESAELSKQLVELTNHLAAIQNSRSWRYTSVLRKIVNQVQIAINIYRRSKQITTQVGGFMNLMSKVIAVIRRDGLVGLQNSISGKVLPHKSIVVVDGQTLDRNDYQSWIKLYDTLDGQAIEKIKTDISGFVKRPKISVVMPVFNAPITFLEEAIHSVQNQIYENWELCIADDASTDEAIRPLLEKFANEDPRIKLILRSENGHISAASNSALSLATGEFVALLDNDDLLSPHALYCVAKAIIENPNVALIYSDEDKVDLHGRRFDPYFKTDWNIDLLYSHNMFSHLGVYRRSLLESVHGFQLGMEGAQDLDLLLRCTERVSFDQIIHLPFILYHWRVHPLSTAMNNDAKPYAMIAGERAINEHFQRTGVKGRVELIGHGYMPHYELPPLPPLVSIIIPTRNAHKLVAQCISSIQSLSTYPLYEILLIDNGSDDPESIQEWYRLEGQGVRVMRDEGPFNYSDLNNKAVIAARGEVIVLLNNDTEVAEPQWLEILVSHALRPGIGAVGAKLLYPDQTIQHAGVVLGLGGFAGAAGHAHYKFPKSSNGYFGRLSLTSNFSAVTGACLAVRRDLYLKVGGLDKVNLRVAFNDVDFCLKLGEIGYRCVYAPNAVLYHHESATRGAEDNSEKKARFQQETAWMRSRWGDLIDNDPYYSPNLTLEHADFSLAWPPRASKVNKNC
jgi:glycosyltransferase involved in cell wall biosynthesis